MQNDQHINSDQNQNTNWLNRNVFAFGLTSFLSDFSHEMATAVLPQFMQSINASAAILGFIEGVAVRDYVDTSVAGTAYGVLGVANGIGDFISSIMVGLLWTVFGPAWAFIFAAIVGLSGTVLMASVPARTHKA
jgi:hypothetical protein